MKEPLQCHLRSSTITDSSTDSLCLLGTKLYQADEVTFHTHFEQVSGKVLKHMLNFMLVSNPTEVSAYF